MEVVSTCIIFAAPRRQTLRDKQRHDYRCCGLLLYSERPTKNDARCIQSRSNVVTPKGT